MNWGPYNVHDPSIMYDGGYFYSYSTDVAYRQQLLRTGAQIRKSRNLIDWEFIGWAFNGTPSQAANYINQNGGTPFESVWAPYIMKSGNEYRLYYSSSSTTPKLSAIGLAVSSKPDGPWVEKRPGSYL
ncbi:MAG: arabinan endo-1,5-alpha-L-arabinosidase [Chlorobi bacterium]|nr:arabinan endo-1,5-alpha-L-arabinosidase [Chlorobiota bacterium]